MATQIISTGADATNPESVVTAARVTFTDLSPAEQELYRRAEQLLLDDPYGIKVRDRMWDLAYEKAIAEGNDEERAGDLADQVCVRALGPG